MISALNKKKHNILKKAGFLPFERKKLVSQFRILPSGKRRKVKPISLTNPFIKNMIRERAKSFRKARKAMEGLSDRAFMIKYRQIIFNDIYLYNNWLDKEGNPDFWQLLRHIESDYGSKYPEYNIEKRKTRDLISYSELEKGERKHIRKIPEQKSKQVGNVVFNKKTGKFEVQLFE
jgi:hypothetical protein|tara:strand:- start:249 stop:776 length:528 start_codon:yes stop_codon:yes gene_type:complete